MLKIPHCFSKADIPFDESILTDQNALAFLIRYSLTAKTLTVLPKKCLSLKLRVWLNQQQYGPEQVKNLAVYQPERFGRSGIGGILHRLRVSWCSKRSFAEIWYGFLNQ